MLWQTEPASLLFCKYVQFVAIASEKMMTNFVREIKGRMFDFERVKHAHEVLYYVCTAHGQHHVKFKMRFKNQQWKIVTGGLPVSVYAEEQLLSDIVVEREASQEY
jgi:hypothetical protein